MPFSEPIKLKIKQRANFTCCWCQDRSKRVDIHHIIPQAEGGLDLEDNGAPLCGSCHDMYGGNPELRKEIRQRRDDWYEKCSTRPAFIWPVELDVPLLHYYRELPPSSGIPSNGIQFTDKDPSGKDGPPLLYLSVHFKFSRLFIDYMPEVQEKWLYIQADMRPAFNLRVHVRAWNNRDVLEIIEFLRKGEGGYNLQGPSPRSDVQQMGDYFYIWRENDENRLMISVFTPTYSGISIHARFSGEATKALADYLEHSGFALLDDVKTRSTS